jgi:hypothetical protein
MGAEHEPMGGVGRTDPPSRKGEMTMAKLSTSAWILHDLGMAAGFGGTLFGKAALDPAVREIRSEEERGKVLSGAWGRYHLINAVALGTMAATWLIGRQAFSGRYLGRSMRARILAKDVLIGAAVVSSAATMIAGMGLSRQRAGGAVPVRSGYEPSERTPRRAARLERFLAAMGPVNTALVAGIIAANTALAQEGAKSRRWGVIERLLLP